MVNAPSFQRRTKMSTTPAAKTSKGSSAGNGKDKQYDGRAMASKYHQKTQKSSSARITGTTWG